MCREAVASQDLAAARAWNASVWLLLALVPLALGAVAFATWRASRRGDEAKSVGGRPRWPSA